MVLYGMDEYGWYTGVITSPIVNCTKIAPPEPQGSLWPMWAAGKWILMEKPNDNQV